MNTFLTQTILAARNEDIEGWMNILIVVVLAVFWAIGGILKARTKKPEQEQEQLADKPTRRQVAMPQVEQLRRKIRRPRPVIQITTPKKPMPVLTSEVLEEPRLPELKPEVQPAVEELPQLISKPVERPEPELAIESLLDYADPDELRRAILHYEILGKPLSLRGPGEHVIGP